MTEEKAKFFPRNQIAHPKSTIQLKRIPRKKLLKLDQWNQRKDDIQAAPCVSSGELYLLNMSTMPREKGGPWTNRQYDKFVKSVDLHKEDAEQDRGKVLYYLICELLTVIERTLNQCGGLDLTVRNVEDVITSVSNSLKDRCSAWPKPGKT